MFCNTFFNYINYLHLSVVTSIRNVSAILWELVVDVDWMRKVPVRTEARCSPFTSCRCPPERRQATGADSQHPPTIPADSHHRGHPPSSTLSLQSSGPQTTTTTGDLRRASTRPSSSPQTASPLDSQSIPLQPSLTGEHMLYSIILYHI